MKKGFLLLIICMATLVSAQQNVKNVLFAQRDTCSLSMDVYLPANAGKNRTCLIFVFGGGFINGSKSEKLNTTFCRALADSGIVVAAIDYRLGMKGVGKAGVLNTKPIENAIQIAVEDLFSATTYMYNHSVDFGINRTRILACGSSAGAITVLQADYERANAHPIAINTLPNGFQYGGIIAFSGAVITHEGKPDYATPPAPTFFFHGIDDKLVNYNKTQFFKKGLFGTKVLVNQFEKYGFPYCAFRYRNMGHEIAESPMTRNLPDIMTFIRDYVWEARPLKRDMQISDPAYHIQISAVSIQTSYMKNKIREKYCNDNYFNNLSLQYFSLNN